MVKFEWFLFIYENSNWVYVTSNTTRVNHMPPASNNKDDDNNHKSLINNKQKAEDEGEH